MAMTAQARVTMATDRQQWNDAVNAAPRADLLQSWEWGEFKRMGGWSPIRLIVTDGDELVAGAQLLSRRVMGAPSLYAPRGPWWRDDARGQAGLAALIAWIRRERPSGAPFLRADPLIADARRLPRGASVPRHARFSRARRSL